MLGLCKVGTANHVHLLFPKSLVTHKAHFIPTIALISRVVSIHVISVGIICKYIYAAQGAWSSLSGIVMYWIRIHT